LKNLFIYLLLVLFSAQCFEQVFIGINFKINQDYFASICSNKDKPELNCNGCCHLKKQLEESDKDKTSKETFASKKIFELFVEEITIENQNPKFNLLLNIYSQLKLFFPPVRFCDIFHPPRA